MFAHLSVAYLGPCKTNDGSLLKTLMGFSQRISSSIYGKFLKNLWMFFQGLVRNWMGFMEALTKV